MNKPIKSKNLPQELQSVRKWMLRCGPESEVKSVDEKTVIYSRYSTQTQKDASEERQHDVCLGYAQFEEYALEGDYFYSDRGLSGDSLDGRASLEKIRRLAREGKIKRVLLYSWCRLSRRPGDAMTVYDEWSTLGVEVHVCSGNVTGPINYFQALLLSIFAMEEREKLLRTTNYAAFAAAAQGRNMAGIPYGFRKGRNTGEIEIDDKKMEIVKRIFTLFVIHLLPEKTIAHILNKDGLVGPRGKSWRAKTIAGIVANPKYIGYLVYGVSKVVRTPGRAKKSRTAGSLKKLKYIHKTELACIDVETFLQADARLGARERGLGGKQQERKSKSVLLLHGSYRCAWLAHAAGNQWAARLAQIEVRFVHRAWDLRTEPFNQLVVHRNRDLAGASR